MTAISQQFVATHRRQNSRVKPGIPVPVDNFTRPDPTRDNDDPTRPYPRVTGRVGYTRGYGYTRKPLVYALSIGTKIIDLG